MKREQDVIIISDHIEIHPTNSSNRWSVVRDGSVYGTDSLEYATELAEELAGESR